MIITGWLSEAVERRGLQDKVYSQPNAGMGIALHSIEGSIEGALSRFLSTARDASGNYTPNAQASCMFLNPFSGPLIQMHPISASTWTSGNWKANTTLWAVESEGRAGQPLNANQVANMLYLCREWEGYRREEGFSPFVATRNPGLRTLWEHNEVAAWAVPNGGPTACPSGRYAPFYEALEQEAEMTEAEIRAIAQEEAGKVFLPLMRQLIGLDESTFSDAATVEAIRTEMLFTTPMKVPPHSHRLDGPSRTGSEISQ